MTFKKQHYQSGIVFFILILPIFLFSQNRSGFNGIVYGGLNLQITSPDKIDTFSLHDMIKGIDKSSFLIDQYGDTLNYKSFANKVVLLDFWFLGCKPCIAEIPGFDLLTGLYKSKPFIVLSLTPDRKEKAQEKLLSKRAFQFSIITDARLVGRLAYPLKILIDKSGKIQDVKSNGSIANNAHLKLKEQYVPLINRWINK